MIENSKTTCKDCCYKNFVAGNGRPGRYYCENPDARFSRSECEPAPLICKTVRHNDAMTIKTRPRWCPLSDEE